MTACDCKRCGPCWQRVIQEKEGRWPVPAGLLPWVGDHPPEMFRYALAQHNEQVRAFVPFIETGATDREVWEALFNDDFRIKTTHAVYGKRCQAPKRKSPQLRLP